jgi:hypothetical protein
MRKMAMHKSRSFREAEEWDIAQQLAMTPEERRKAAYELKKRFYGPQCPDVRESCMVRVLHSGGAGWKPIKRT